MATAVLAISRTVVYEERVEVIECADCNIDFGIGARFMAARRNDHRTFYCPNGHQNYYPGKTVEEKIDRLERELSASRSLAKRESRRRTNAEQEARAADYRARAAKGQLTKARKAIARGECPCCKKRFPQLFAHMAAKHPDYAVPDPTE